jgi:hypothetical protein
MTIAPSVYSTLTAKQTIWQLAQQHGITHQHSQLDQLGDSITRLSDEEIILNETQWLLIELGRAHILTGRESISLLNRYLQEESAQGVCHFL